MPKQKQCIVRYVEPNGMISRTKYLTRIHDLGRSYGVKSDAKRFDSRDDAIFYADRLQAVVEF